MQKRAKVAIAAGAVLLTISLLIAALSPREPRYQGLTMGQWLKRREHAQAHQALLLLGTNNLPLLIKRITYDRQKDPFYRALDRLPSRLKFTPWVDRLRSHRVSLSWEATQVLFTIGTNAAPAIPKLAAIVRCGGFPPPDALDVLERLGDDGLAVVASTAARATDVVLRQYAVAMLINHPESTLARAAVTNALADPSPNIRGLARFYTTNRPAPDGFE